MPSSYFSIFGQNSEVLFTICYSDVNHSWSSEDIFWCSVTLWHYKALIAKRMFGVLLHYLHKVCWTPIHQLLYRMLSRMFQLPFFSLHFRSYSMQCCWQQIILRRCRLSYPSSSRHWMGHLLSSGVRLALSKTLLCPIQSLLALVALARRQPTCWHVSAIFQCLLWVNVDTGTFFLNCLWIASNASLIVTPLRFRAVTSSPRGKCRSIFLTGGLVRNFLRVSLSSSVAGDVLSFLRIRNQHCFIQVIYGWDSGFMDKAQYHFGLDHPPVQFLCLLCYFQFLAFLFCSSLAVSLSPIMSSG